MDSEYDRAKPKRITPVFILAVLLLSACNQAISLEPGRQTSSPVIPASPQLPLTSTPAYQPGAMINPVSALSLQVSQPVSLTGITSFSWLPDSRGITLIKGNEVVAYNLSPAKAQSQTAAQNPSMLTVAPSQSTVAWVSDKTNIYVWKPGGGAGAEALSQSASPVTGLTVSPKGNNLAYSTYDKSLSVADPASGKVTQTWQAPSWLANLTYSPDGTLLGGADLANFTVYIIDAQKGTIQRTLQWVGSASPDLYGAFFSSDWHSLAWVARSAVQLMDVASGNLGPLLNHEDSITAVAWSPDGQLLASAAAATVNGSLVPAVLLWESPGGKLIKSIPQQSPVQSLSFSPDGKQLATLDSAGHLQLLTVGQ